MHISIDIMDSENPCSFVRISPLIQEVLKIMSLTLFDKVKSKLIPLVLGYVVVGLGYGIVMRSLGFHPLMVGLISGTVYAGGLQYAAIPLFFEDFDPLSTLVFAFFVNFRHVFYGISMLKPYSNTGLSKIFLIFSLSDEVFAINSDLDDLPGQERKQAYVLNASFLYRTWVIMTVLGALIGSLDFMNLSGLDFAMTALFLAIAGGLLDDPDKKSSLVWGLGSSMIARVIFGPEAFLIPALLMMVVILFVFWRREAHVNP